MPVYHSHLPAQNSHVGGVKSTWPVAMSGLETRVNEATRLREDRRKGSAVKRRYEAKVVTSFPVSRRLVDLSGAHPVQGMRLPRVITRIGRKSHDMDDMYFDQISSTCLENSSSPGLLPSRSLNRRSFHKTSVSTSPDVSSHTFHKPWRGEERRQRPTTEGQRCSTRPF